MRVVFWKSLEVVFKPFEFSKSMVEERKQHTAVGFEVARKCPDLSLIGGDLNDFTILHQVEAHTAVLALYFPVYVSLSQSKLSWITHVESACIKMRTFDMPHSPDDIAERFVEKEFPSGVFGSSQVGRSAIDTGDVIF